MKKDNQTTDSFKLRQLAEKMLENSPEADEDLSKRTPRDMESLIHELRVHQIELKMQNEELKRIQQELEKARDRYSHLYDFAPTGYITMTEKGMITDANLTIAQLLGVERGRLIGKFLTHFVLSEDQDIFYEHRQQLMETQPPRGFELRLVQKERHPIYVRLECKIVKTNEDDVREIRATVSDITDRKRAEEKLLKSERQLKQSQKMEAIGTLAGGIAHDFNNILSSVLGFTQLALDEAAKGSSMEDNLQEVYIAGTRAKDLVKQILAFSRQADDERIPIQVDIIATEVIKLVRSTIPKNIEIKENIKSRSSIMGNSSQVHQLFLNLLTNAAQAMENTGGRIEVRMTDVELHDPLVLRRLDLKSGTYTKVTVSDTGPGISPDIIDSIFDPYFTTKGVGKGTGMGLSLVHGIVESYGGKITVESEPGRGTVFSLYLPGLMLPEKHGRMGDECS